MCVELEKVRSGWYISVKSGKCFWRRSDSLSLILPYLRVGLEVVGKSRRSLGLEVKFQSPSRKVRGALCCGNRYLDSSWIWRHLAEEEEGWRRRTRGEEAERRGREAAPASARASR